MPEEREAMRRPKFTLGKQWILCALILGVFFLSILAFTSPVSEGVGQSASTATIAPADQTSESTETPLTTTPDIDAIPPTPEEIGFTDGIIIWSTILIIILLIGTFKEIFRREGR